MLALITYPSAIEGVGLSNLFVFKMGKKHLCGNSFKTGKYLVIVNAFYLY